MIQDIYPKKLNNEYQWKSPKADSRVMIFHGDRILCRIEGDMVSYLTYGELGCYEDALTYLFSIGELTYYFYPTEEKLHIKGYGYEKMFHLRRMQPQEEIYAGVTAYHLYQWYWDNRYCGRCGKSFVPDKKERMLRCEGCGNTVYPRINPAVIVAVCHGDEILLTKYADREYKRYALIAGFAEIGETLEDTARREVLEEVGIQIENIRYYKSQPWGFSGGLLMGFFADAVGDLEIHRQEEELSEALWVKRKDVVLDPEEISLTREMMKVFKEKEIK